MGYRRWGKRLLDVSLAGAGLILFALPMAWIASRIRKQAGPPVFYRQVRIGFGGRRFLLKKFRTLQENRVFSPFALRLRATAMDELPQLIHIFKGQMSFVGPRPLIPEELEEIQQVPGGERRFTVRPGLTGLAQLKEGKCPRLKQRLRWDLTYIDRCSLRLDLTLILRSVGVTLRSAWEKKG